MFCGYLKLLIRTLARSVQHISCLDILWLHHEPRNTSWTPPDVKLLSDDSQWSLILRGNVFISSTFCLLLIKVKKKSYLSSDVSEKVSQPVSPASYINNTVKSRRASIKIWTYIPRNVGSYCTQVSTVAFQVPGCSLRLSASISHVIKQARLRGRGRLNSAAQPHTAPSACCMNHKHSNSVTLLKVV